MSLLNEINLLQRFFRGVAGVTNSPELTRYPSVIDTNQLPLVLTELQESNPKGGEDVNEAEDKFIVTVYVSPLSAPNHGHALLKCTNLIDSVREAVLDNTTNFATEGQRLLQIQPYKILFSLENFLISGHKVVEYPLGTETYWHGFTVDCTLKVDWRMDCGC